MSKQTINNQSGMASLIISMILVMIMGVIVLGLAEVRSVSNKEATDRKESTQATYAAESGVNDVIAALNNGTAVPDAAHQQTCTGPLSAIAALGLNPTLSTSPNVAYTCLNVSAAPSSLIANLNQTETSAVLKLDPAGPVSTLEFTWPESNDAIPPTDCTKALEFEPLADWDSDCPFAVLRMDLYENNPASDNTPQALENDTDSFFLFPLDTGPLPADTINFGTNPYGSASPVVVAADCTSGSCIAKFNFGGSGTFTGGYVRLTSIYYPAGNVTITGSPSAFFDNSQVAIDSTGIDQDEVQRIQVRVPISPGSGTAPSYAADAYYELCKNYSFLAAPNSATDPDHGTDPGLLTLGDGQEPLCGVSLKPAIYLYPTHAEDVNVKLHYPTGFVTTTPTYNPVNGWNVLAQPNGQLTNLADGKQYPYLYWEGNLDTFNFDMSQGFVVAGNDTAAFLRQELPKTGLDQTEITAFMQYWVPKMVNNKYSLIHFAGSEYTNMAPLNITPKPDAMLRVFMAEEPIDEPVKVTPQTFKPFQRTGFTVVEWGGTVLSN